MTDFETDVSCKNNELFFVWVPIETKMHFGKNNARTLHSKPDIRCYVWHENVRVQYLSENTTDEMYASCNMFKNIF